MEESPNADKELMVVFISGPHSSVTFGVDEKQDALLLFHLLQNIKKLITKLQKDDFAAGKYKESSFG